MKRSIKKIELLLVAVLLSLSLASTGSTEEKEAKTPASVAEKKNDPAPEINEQAYRVGGLKFVYPAGVKVEKGEVTFIAEATIGSFSGKTDLVGGTIIKRSADEKPTGRIEINLVKLGSDNQLRDEKMHGHYLETAKYPEAVFQLDRLDISGEKPTASGSLSLHGVTRKIEMELDVNAIEGRLRVGGKVNINLDDYNIEQPVTALVLTVEKDITVVFDLTLRALRPDSIPK